MSRKRKILIVSAVVVVVAVVVGSALATELATGVSSPRKYQVLSISGTETIRVIAPDGRVTSTWTGADPLIPGAINAMAACISGVTTANVGNYPCYGMIGKIHLETDSSSGTCTSVSPNCWSYDIFNQTSPFPIHDTLTPPGCTPRSELLLCNGWITTATFGPSTFTSTNCGSQCSVELVSTDIDVLCTTTWGTYYGGVPCQPASPPASFATVSAGDSLAINIQFTVS